MSGEKRARLVRRLSRVGVAAVLVGAIAGFAVSQLIPQRYEATADVLVTPSPGATGSDVIDDRLLESYAQVLSGRQTAVAALKAAKSSLSAGEVDDSVSAHVVSGSTIVRVTGRHSDPEIAAELATAAAQVFTAQLIKDKSAVGPGTTTKKKSTATEETIDPTTGATTETPATTNDSSDSKSSEKTSPVQVAVSQEAVIPSSPVSPNRGAWTLLGALVALLIAVPMSMMRQTTDRRIRSSEALADLTGLPLIGAFGFDRDAARQTLATDLDPSHPRFEAARIMRTNLQFLDVDQSSSVFTITSSVPGEGKTTVAANVAVALARGGQSVILIDGDLRRPRLAALFDVNSSVGLTSALVGKAPLEKAISATRVPGLDVLPSGTRPPNPAELLQTQAMSDLLTELSRIYDVVLIDAPPLLPVTDAALLAGASDGALLVVRHGRTTQEQISTSIDRLDGVGATLYGTVLTMVPARGADKYGYGYGYGAPPAASAGRRADDGRRARR